MFTTSIFLCFSIFSLSYMQSIPVFSMKRLVWDTPLLGCSELRLVPLSYETEYSDNCLNSSMATS